MVLKDPERMGNDEEAMALGVRSDKALSYAFITAHILVSRTGHSAVFPNPNHLIFHFQWLQIANPDHTGST